MQTTRQTTDAELITRSLDGDDGAFRDLVRRYQGLAFSVARAITRNDADAADAAQEALIRFHRRLDQFDPRRPLKPYLLKIVANCSRNLLAARARRREIDDPRQEDIAAVHPGVGPATRMLRQERYAAVRALVGRLPTTLREVCSLFYLAECSCREVAEILQMSETAVKVALHRARRRLLDSGAREWRRA